MSERTTCLVTGTAFASFWLGGLAARWANGLPVGFSALDGLTLAIAGWLLLKGRAPTGSARAAD